MPLEKMIYSLLVHSPPSSASSATAAHFAAALTRRGHEVLRVFFLDDGVWNGLGSAVAAQDHSDTLALWQDLAAEHQVELVVCVSSALRRGVLDQREAGRHEHDCATLDPAFTIGGLGLLVEATAESDRLWTFGG